MTLWCIWYELVNTLYLMQSLTYSHDRLKLRFLLVVLATLEWAIIMAKSHLTYSHIIALLWSSPPNLTACLQHDILLTLLIKSTLWTFWFMAYHHQSVERLRLCSKHAQQHTASSSAVNKLSLNELHETNDTQSFKKYIFHSTLFSLLRSLISHIHVSMAIITVIFQ